MKHAALALICLALPPASVLAITADSLEYLPGTWNCEANFSEEGVRVSVASRDTFGIDGAIISEGSVNIAFPGDMEPMLYKSRATGTWQWRDDKLFGTMTGLSLTNQTYPELDQLFSPSTMLPEKVSGYFTIEKLDSNALHLRSSNSSVTYLCQH